MPPPENLKHTKSGTEKKRVTTRTIAPALLDKNAGDQSEIDRLILNLDGTPNKTRLGANATLAVSLAVARAAAAFYHQPLYRYIGGVSAVRLPVPMMNILNGGAHAANNLDVQEFMIVPIGANNFAEGLRWGAEIYHVLGDILRRRALSTTVGDEGGYAPDLDSDEAALNLIAESIHEAGYDGRVKIALDIASSEWGNGSVYLLPKRKIRYTAAELIAYYQRLCERYPILSIEDGLGEEDYTGWREMTEVLGKNVMLVGDDLFVTNEARLLSGITGHTYREKRRIPLYSLPPLRGDGGYLHCRPCRGHQRPLYQIRRPLPWGAGGKIQPSASH